MHPENSPSRVQFYMQKTKSSLSITTTYRGQRDLHSRKEILRIERQGDLLEMHLCVLQDLPRTFPDIPVFPDIPDIPVFPVFPDISVVQDHSRDIPDIPVIHDLSASSGISTSSSISRESIPFQHSPIRMHILQFDWFPQKNSTEYQLNNTNYKHSTNITFFKEREML